MQRRESIYLYTLRNLSITNICSVIEQKTSCACVYQWIKNKGDNSRRHVTNPREVGSWCLSYLDANIDMSNVKQRTIIYFRAGYRSECFSTFPFLVGSLKYFWLYSSTENNLLLLKLGQKTFHFTPWKVHRNQKLQGFFIKP